MCALWTTNNMPEDEDLLRIYLPRNLSTSDNLISPIMHRLYAWQDPPQVCCDIAPTHSAPDNGQHSQPKCPLIQMNSHNSTSLDNDLTNPNGPFASNHLLSSAGDNAHHEKNLLYVETGTNHAANPEASPIYQENEYQYYQPKRSSSLKVRKSPPNTPGRKKIVRFADAFGLDLETIRHVFNTECPPKVPSYATNDLNLGNNESYATQGSRYIATCFPQPAGSATFLQSVMQRNVSLENVLIDKTVLTGTIRVRSITFRKVVYIRITFDDWGTFTDIQASYVQDSYDGLTDRFSFAVVFPHSFVVGSKAHFAIRYDTEDGQIFWDSNNGVNYTIECFAKTTGAPNDDTWMHFL